jgi:hypothetical protein
MTPQVLFTAGNLTNEIRSQEQKIKNLPKAIDPAILRRERLVLADLYE